MNAGELFKLGRLHEAIEAQTQEVKSHPADHGKRLFLFELLAFAGDLDRAQRQIDVVRYEEVELEAATQAYRQLLDAERARRHLFQDGTPPQSLAAPPEHVGLRLQALDQLRQNRADEAAELLARPAAASHEIKGTLNGKPFDVLRDADDLFGSVLEVMSRGAYFWVPLEQVESLTLNAPRYPRDLLWMPAHLSVRGGPEGDVFLPALYPGSHEHADETIKLGRSTEWKTVADGLVRGQGARMFLAGEDAAALLEWRELVVAR